MTNRFVVYTVIVGGYDEVKQPLVIDDRFDYVLFSDTHTEKRIGVWQIRTIDYKTNKNYLKARYPRLNPEKVLQEYDAWLYHDGTMQIKSSKVYDRCIQYFMDDTEWVGIKHHCRSNVYEEMSAIILDKDKNMHDYDCVDWYWHMKREGYPNASQLNGNLIETGFIFRIQTPNVKEVNSLWWESLEKYNVHRDQFSLPMAIWKVPTLRFAYFLGENEDLWNNPYVQYTKHIVKRGELVRCLGETIRYRCWRIAYKGELYTHLFDNAYKITRTNPHYALKIYTLYLMIRYGGLVIKEMTNSRVRK